MKKYLIAIALACLGFADRAAAEDVTVAVNGPMTGSYASFGSQFKIGGEAAIADICHC